MDKNKLKIALISLQQDAEKVPPVGLVYLATYLSERIGIKKENIKIFDKNYFDVEKEVDYFKPNIIGISAMTIDYQKAVSFALQIKEKLDIPIIIGGVHISTLPESFNQCFDVGVIGEGEHTLGELIELYLKESKFSKKKLEKIKGIIYYDSYKIKNTPVRPPINLDSLPLPNFKFVHPDYFRKQEVPGVNSVAIKGNLISSRGCPYKCVFCSTSRFWGKMRMHSPKYTARLAEKLVKEHGVDYLGIIDDLFTISPQRLREIKKEFEKRGILNKIKWIGCTVRANLMNDELCREMKKLKIKIINFGFESGSEKILKYLKAGSVSVEMNKNAILLGKKYNFNVYGSLMYASPSETIEDMKKTNEFIDFCIKNGASNIWSFVATPFPATPFWQIALDRGTVSNKMDFSLLDHHISKRPLLLDSEISFKEFKKVFLNGRKKLRKLRIKLIKNFLLKNPVRTIELVFKEPKYYINRIMKQLFKQ